MAALAGIAMVGTLSIIAMPAADAAGATCQVTEGKWSEFVNCVNGVNARAYSTIALASDVTAGTDGGVFDLSSYEEVTFAEKATIEGNGHSIKWVHFVVTNGGDLTLDNTKVDDNQNGTSTALTADSEIPVFVSNGSFTLSNGSSLVTNEGSASTLGAAIIAGDNATVNLESAVAGETPAVRGSDAAILTSNDSSKVIQLGDAPVAEPVSGTTINITAGDIINENSQNDGYHAVNVNGATVNVSGGNVQEVYVNNGTYVQTGGRVWPNLDNKYGSGLSESSIQYPLSLDGSAQAFVTGGTLTGNYKSDQGQQGKAVLLRTSQTKFNIRPEGRIELGGYDSSDKNLGAGETVPGTVVNAGTGFSTPVQGQHASSFTSTYADTGLSKTYEGAALRTFPARDGENAGTAFGLADEVARGTAADASELEGSSWVNGTSVAAALTANHTAQFIYAVWAVQDQHDYVASTSDDIAHQIYLYGAPSYVPSYYDWYKGADQAAGQRPSQSNGDDRLFAGWYGDDTLAQSLSNPATQQYPFGYFVSKDTQNVFVQRSAGDAKGRFSLRVLYGAPKGAEDKHYVFKVKFVNGKTEKEFTLTTSSLYTKAESGTKDAGNQQILTPAELAAQLGVSAGEAQYFTGGYINNVPVAWANATIQITPAWVTADGTSVSRGITAASVVPADANATKSVAFADR